jgi:choline monooxygenase
VPKVKVGFSRYASLKTMSHSIGVMSDDLVNSDIRVAKTLPSEHYTDPECFQNQMEAFKTTWQFLGSSDQFKSAIAPLHHLDSILNEPLIRTETDEGVHLLSNVCTHRGMVLCHEHSNKKTIQCPYHGRTFRRNGTLKHMPGFEQALDFPTHSDNLPAYRLETWNGFEFTTLHSQSSLETMLRPVEERIGWFLNELKHDAAQDRDWDINAHWMLYVDNYLEGFHIPFVHPELNDALGKDGYTTECFEHGVLQIGLAADGDICFELPEDSIDYGKNIAAYYWWLYPNLMLNVYPWGISVNIVVPTSVDSTQVLFRSYVKREDLLNMGAGAELDKVELQDQFVVENCMKGLRSESYSRGRYSPEHERGVHHFHRMMSSIK